MCGHDCIIHLSFQSCTHTGRQKSTLVATKGQSVKHKQGVFVPLLPLYCSVCRDYAVILQIPRKREFILVSPCPPARHPISCPALDIVGVASLLVFAR